ncbi:hypothetical protein ACFW04_002101 [Cataglyphis niger]
MERRSILKSLHEYTEEDYLKSGMQLLCAHAFKSYKCDICDIRFINEVDLINHKQVHAVKKNRCGKNCKITFQDYTSLYEHDYKEHGLYSKYSCPYCFKNYRRYLNYYYHFVQEHECKCDICFEEHGDYPTLLEHYKEKHSEEKKREIERYYRSQEKELKELLENLN